MVSIKIRNIKLCTLVHIDRMLFLKLSKLNMLKRVVLLCMMVIRS